ncbi:class I SAM-dependent methyltransferase [Microbacterium jejuense]|uniref:Class I SAM-dependent methyltransferase n=1 Tax=Microbacterium jejuense TaxID=1263637 RepID=A0ABS7HN74_9MICO|nr:class I SAM-dependent methyltransferase [Microbacterium jejuense]MBW9093865.1 class I SAM-dependent methyltransferase [Microbacterium jejuense]
MVTLPSQPHDHRAIAEGFGSDAARYDRARPQYPTALADEVLDGLSGRRVLDVGIGTGIAALPFLRAGCDVHGVEPDERMAEIARARGISVDIARFEEWDAPGRRFDAVISGQSWHWIEPVVGAQRAAAALVDGGRIALFWNAGDPPREIAAGFAEVYRSVETGLPFTPFASDASAAEGYGRFVDAAAEGLRAAGAFRTPRPLRITWSAHVTREAWLDQVPTSGGHDSIPPESLERLLQGMGSVIDRAGGAFEMAYTTVGLLAERAPRE